jgi:DNA polymerase-1
MDHHNDEDIFIFTNDRDIAQMLDLNITILFSNIDTPITKKNFMLHFDYHHSNVLTIKVLTGDSSDNIKGIKGLGEKGLIKKFPELTYKHMTVNEICTMGIKINKERVENNKNPLKVFENLIKSRDLLINNHKIINLHEPFLNDEAYDALEVLNWPLDCTNRGSKNLYYLMNRDGFLSIYGYDFVSFVEPFYPVITKEQDIFKKYLVENS